MEQNYFALRSPRAKCVCVGGREILRVYAPQVLGESCAAEHFRSLCEILEQHALSELAKSAKIEFEACHAQHADFLPHFVRVDVDFFEKAMRLYIELSYSHIQGKETLFLYRLPTFWSKDGALQYRKARSGAKKERIFAGVDGQARKKRKM